MANGRSSRVSLAVGNCNADNCNFSCVIAGGSRKPARDVSQHAVFRVVLKLTCMMLYSSANMYSPRDLLMCRKHVIPRHPFWADISPLVTSGRIRSRRHPRAVLKASCDYFAANLEVARVVNGVVNGLWHQEDTSESATGIS